MSTLQTKGPSGRKLQITAPTGGVSSGDIYALRTGTSGWCGIVVDDADAGDTAVVEYGHQVEVPKNTTSGEAFAVGDLVYKSASTGKATATATGNDLMGAATAAAAVADTHVWVQLNLA